MSDYFELPTINDRICNGCGACCMRIGAPPFISYDDDDYDFQILPAHLKRELQELISDQGPAEARLPNNVGTPCIWLDTVSQECRHYEHRPFCCREFQPGSDLCLEERKLSGIHTPVSEDYFS